MRARQSAYSSPKRDGLSPDGEQVLVEVGRIRGVSGLSQRVADPRSDGFTAEGVAVCVPQDELTCWSRAYAVLDAPAGKELAAGTIGQRYLDCDHVLHSGSMPPTPRSGGRTRGPARPPSRVRPQVLDGTHPRLWWDALQAQKTGAVGVSGPTAHPHVRTHC